MTTRMGLMVAVGLMLSGCAMEATEVARDGDDSAITGRGRDISAGRLANGRSTTPIPPEFQGFNDRVGWQDNPLRDEPGLIVDPKIPFQPKPDIPR